jgi:hypothetical protein
MAGWGVSAAAWPPFRRRFAPEQLPVGHSRSAYRTMRRRRRERPSCNTRLRRRRLIALQPTLSPQRKLGSPGGWAKRSGAPAGDASVRWDDAGEWVAIRAAGHKGRPGRRASAPRCRRGVRRAACEHGRAAPCTAMCMRRVLFESGAGRAGDRERGGNACAQTRAAGQLGGTDLPPCRAGGPGKLGSARIVRGSERPRRF